MITRTAVGLIVIGVLIAMVGGTRAYATDHYAYCATSTKTCGATREDPGTLSLNFNGCGTPCPGLVSCAGCTGDNPEYLQLCLKGSSDQSCNSNSSIHCGDLKSSYCY